MLAASKVCCMTLPLTRTILLNKKLPCSKTQIIKSPFWRTFSNDGRESYSRGARRRTIKETIMAPAGDTAFNIGKGAVAGGAVFGIGALCFYGLGLSNKAGAIDQAVLWPEYVKERIKSTYFYFGSSIAITAASAVTVFRSPVMMNLLSKNSFLAIAGTFAAMIGSGMVARGIEYRPGFGAKQMAWIVHSAIMGAVLAPMCILGGPLVMRAAWYTAGVVGGLSAVAVCAPSDKFLNMTGPLAIGLGVVFASSLGKNSSY
uniref:Growth hormone-inducible transmembrane protein n=1 Tax=Clastoptera arizonana TaxID=38151 RepID=A0A1B6CLG6_9HEMI